MTRLLSRSDVTRLLNMREAINILEIAFDDLAKGKITSPQNTRIDALNYNGMALMMPSYIKGTGAFGSKMVTVYKDNPVKYEIDKVMGTISLLDHKNGSLLALMDARYITSVRQGAVAAMATRQLSRPDSRVHSIIGTGDIAKAAAWAIDCVREISKLVIFSKDDMDKQKRFVQNLRDIIGCEIVLAESAEEAVQLADILTLAENTQKPIIQGGWLKEGTHVNAIGTHTSSMRELDAECLNRSKVVCDLVKPCIERAGDLVIAQKEGTYDPNNIHGSLSEILLDKISSRDNQSEITLFKSVGLVFEDISIAHMVYLRALAQNAGVEFNFNN